MLSVSLHLAGRRLIAHAESLVLNPEILHLLLADLELHCDFVSLFLGCLLLRLKDVLMHLDLFLSLFHAHLKLVLPVLQPVDMISLHIHCVPQVLNLELHYVMLDECLLFYTAHFSQVNLCEFVDQVKLVNCIL